MSTARAGWWMCQECHTLFDDELWLGDICPNGHWLCTECALGHEDRCQGGTNEQD